MDTVLSSPTKEVLIGPDHPFVIIGERINPTGRSKLAAEMASGNFERVTADALAQVQAGAQVLDVNAGIPMADEPAIMAEAIRLVQSVTDVPISIDSSVIKALESGLAAVKGKALINSVTGEEERLEAVLPLAKRFGAAVIGISNDETGISQDPDVRFAVAKKIVERAETFGIPRQDVLIDPLVLPVGAVGTAGPAVYRLLRRLREELGVNTVCGASNVSFGLPDRCDVERRLPDNGDRQWVDQRHHQPARGRPPEACPGRQRDDGPRRELHALAQGGARGGQGGGRGRRRTRRARRERGAARRRRRYPSPETRRSADGMARQPGPTHAVSCTPAFLMRKGQAGSRGSTLGLAGSWNRPIAFVSAEESDAAARDSYPCLARGLQRMAGRDRPTPARAHPGFAAPGAGPGDSAPGPRGLPMADRSRSISWCSGPAALPCRR